MRTDIIILMAHSGRTNDGVMFLKDAILNLALHGKEWDRIGFFLT